MNLNLILIWVELIKQSPKTNKRADPISTLRREKLLIIIIEVINMNIVKAGERMRKAERFLLVFLFFFLVSCFEKNDKRDYSSAKQSPQINISQDVIISEKVRDRGFRDVRSFIPEYAILACDEIKIEDEFLVDSFVSLKGPYGGDNVGEGSVATNGKFKAENRSRVTGSLVLGSGGTYEIGSGSYVGSVTRVDKLLCPRFEEGFLRASEYNDNDKIPEGFIDEEGNLKLEGGEVLELPSGVYYFKSLKLESGSELRFSGITFVFLECEICGGKGGKGKGKSKDKEENCGCLKVENGSVLGVFPSELRVFVKGKVKVEGKGKIYGFIASESEVKVEDEGEVFGAILASKFKGENKGKVHFDQTFSKLWISWGDKRRAIIAEPRFQILIPSNSGVQDFLSENFVILSFADLVGPELFPTTIGGAIGDVVILKVSNLEDIKLLQNLEIKFQSSIMYFADSMVLTGLVAPFIVATVKEGYEASEVFSDYDVIGFWEITPGMYIVRLNERNVFDIFPILERMLADPRVEHADPDTIALLGFLQAPPAIPNDPQYTNQWYFGNVEAPEGWQFVYGGAVAGIHVIASVSAVNIAIVDTGVDINHRDLTNILFFGQTGERTSSGNHGTMVAGVAGAHTNNRIDIAGMMWTDSGDRIIPYDFGDGGVQTVGNALGDIVDAVREGAVSINASWIAADGSFTQQQISLLAWALYCGRGGVNCRVQYNAANGQCRVTGTQGLGTILVFSAGNGSGCCTNINNCFIVRTPCPTDCQYVTFTGTEPDQCRTNGSPAACYCPFELVRVNNQIFRFTEPQEFARQPCFEGRMITVGATDVNNNRATFSTVAPHVTVAAPGDNILTLSSVNPPVDTADGTSFSAPLVTGLTGLILKLNPSLTVQDVFRIVSSSARDLGAAGRDNIFGFGIISVERAVAYTLFTGNPSPQVSPPADALLISDSPGSITLTSLNILNRIENRSGTLYGVVGLRVSDGGKGSITGSITLQDGRSTSDAILVVAPGQTATIQIRFEKNADYMDAATFTLWFCARTSEATPDILHYFGGSINFPEDLTKRREIERSFKSIPKSFYLQFL